MTVEHGPGIVCPLPGLLVVVPLLERFYPDLVVDEVVDGVL